MSSQELPPCRHRGAEFFPARWVCHSQQVIAFKGATADLCRSVCPVVDHLASRSETSPLVVGGTGYGVVIGTYDSLHSKGKRFGTEAVELNLAVLRASCHDQIRILVCDDGSPVASQRRYRSICEEYDAEFMTLPQRMGHSSGDMIVFHNAIVWAHQHRLRTVTKLSHRMMIETKDWVQDDSESLIASGFATQTQMLANFGIEQIRTECVMMVVDRWHSADVLRHFEPRTIPYWNESHVFQAVARFVDPAGPYPHFRPWPGLAFYRGLDQPPFFFREMQGDAEQEFRALARRHGVKLSSRFSTVDSCRTLDYQ